MRLFHVSEEDNIDVFIPRVLDRRKDIEQDSGLVWAVTMERLYNYLLPRECPRISTFKTGEGDFNSLEYSNILLAVEKDWIDRINSCKLFIYEFDTNNFSLQDECAGYYVSKSIERPINKFYITNCFEELDHIKVDVMILEDLWDLRDQILAETSNFSFCCMKNAKPR